MGARRMAKSKKDKEKEQKILEHKRQVEEEAVKKDLEERYPNYRQDWDYDPYERTGVHKATGFSISDILIDIGRRLQYNNLHQFYGKMRAQGMNTEQIEAYRRDLHNQFYFITKAEAIWTPKPRTFEEQLADLREDCAWKLQAVKDQGDRSEEEIEQLAQHFAKKIQEFIASKGKASR